MYADIIIPVRTIKNTPAVYWLISTAFSTRRVQ